MKTKFHLLTAFVLCFLLANQSFAQNISLNAQAVTEAKSRRQPIREVTLTSKDDVKNPSAVHQINGA